MRAAARNGSLYERILILPSPLTVLHPAYYYEIVFQILSVLGTVREDWGERVQPLSGWDIPHQILAGFGLHKA